MIGDIEISKLVRGIAIDLNDGIIQLLIGLKTRVGDPEPPHRRQTAIPIFLEIEVDKRFRGGRGVWDDMTVCQQQIRTDQETGGW